MSTTGVPPVGELVDALRRRPDAADQLAALLPENLPVHTGLDATETARLRGYLLAAFADTGLPPAALPYVLESLETGDVADEVAGAAIALRGLREPVAEAAPALARALRNTAGTDATVSFESYRPCWPYARPTTVLTEIVRTLAALGGLAGPAHHELAALVQHGRLSGSVLAEAQDVLGTAETARGACSCASGNCGCCSAEAAPSCCDAPDSSKPAPNVAGLDVVLEDQEGRTAEFDDFFSGRPTVVAFFYTRCENPQKCTLTITRLAALQRSLKEDGLDGAVRIAAITYDPAFDVPDRLRTYGDDRGVRFGEHVRFFRARSGFDDVRRRFDLGVNYGAATVNRHRTELFLLDSQGHMSAAWTRVQWDVAAVRRALGALLAAQDASGRPPGQERSGSTGSS